MDYENLRQLMKADRTIRRFHEDKKVPIEILEKLVELTRYCHSGRNAQPLRYVLVTSEDEREKIFPLLKWAAYFKNWEGPEKGEDADFKYYRTEDGIHHVPKRPLEELVIKR